MAAGHGLLAEKEKGCAADAAAGGGSHAEGGVSGAGGAPPGCGSQAGAELGPAGRGPQAECDLGVAAAAAPPRGSQAEEDLGWRSDSQQSMEPSPGKEARRSRGQRRNGSVPAPKDNARRGAERGALAQRARPSASSLRPPLLAQPPLVRPAEAVHSRQGQFRPAGPGAARRGSAQ